MSITINEHLTEALKKLGIANLRLQQEAPMEAILNNEDVIVLMPTSGGKSLLYQLPAVMEPGQPDARHLAAQGAPARPGGCAPQQRHPRRCPQQRPICG